VEAFFKKNAHFSDDAKCEAAALLSFLEAENICGRTNKRLAWYYLHPDHLDPDIAVLLRRMERWIDSTLGPIEPFLESIPATIRLTNGATSVLKRKAASPARKLARVKTLAAAPGSIPYLDALGRYFGLKRLPRGKRMLTNRVAFVPKNWKTKRTIAAEPEGSLPFQLCFDEYAKVRLARKGVDLTNQSRNQELARLASCGEKIATLDLKQASDTCAFNAVALLFPEPWFEYLRAHRSQSWLLSLRKDKMLGGSYSKFSSMGNGSTFAIETLLFSAACKASGASVWSVYGDDIIVDSDCAEAVMKVLRYLGFAVNPEKSHLSGSYHESCGEHWASGTYVTPFFLRDDGVRGAELCHAVNGLAGIAVPGGALAGFLASLVLENKLPLVPYSENTLNGVHVSVPTCYNLGIFRRSGKKRPWGTPRYIGYQPTTLWATPEGHLKELHELSESERASLQPGGSIGLWLWYLDSSKRDLERARGDRPHEVLERRETARWVPPESLPFLPELQAKRLSFTWDVPAFTYRKRSCRWWLPSRPTPHTIYWWSEHLEHALCAL
jgi:hypothetical protein